MKAGTTSRSTTVARSCSDIPSARTATRMISSASSSALKTANCSTLSGSWRWTRLIASRTSAAARSTSELGLNTARIRVLPSSLLELTSLTPLTRATAPSRMRVTSASMVSGEAPGKFARTLTTGSSTSGSSRTSMAKTATRPAMAISRFITATNQGRFTPSAGNPAPARLLRVVFMRESQKLGLPQVNLTIPGSLAAHCLF